MELEKLTCTYVLIIAEYYYHYNVIYSGAKLLHNQLRLSLLCTRRGKFMLKLIFKLSKSEENVELYRPDIRLRGREKV